MMFDIGADLQRAYDDGIAYAWEVAQKVFNSTVTFYEAEDVAKQIDKDINVRSKDEPQTCDDCIWNVCNYNKAFEDEPNSEECKHFNEQALTYMKQCKYYFMECRFEPKE